MKLSISSTHPLQQYYLKDINEVEHKFQLDQKLDLPAGWYELRVDYVDTKIDISDIKINDSSIKHLLYTGYYTDGAGKVHQPATAVWDTGGFFSIWIHTEIGMMFSRFFDAIRNGDFGKNLFDQYTLTVDRPKTIRKDWPAHIRSFYSLGYGPQWWRKEDTQFPWKYCDVPTLDVDQLLQQLDKILPYSYEKQKGYHIKQLKEKSGDLPLVELQDIDSTLFRELATSVGYKRIIDISVQTLEPNTFIDIHRDDHYQWPAYPYMKGCKKFYWACKAHKGVYFKLGNSGLLPLDGPLMINTIDHTHSVVHEGDSARTSILVYGEI